MNHIFVFFLVAVVALFGSYRPAAAYLDPATTSYVLELVITIVAVVGAAGGYYFRKIKNKVKKEELPTDVTDVSEEEQLTKKE